MFLFKYYNATFILIITGLIKMEPEYIEKIAEGKKLNKEELESKLLEFKDENYRILEAIYFAYNNQKCSLHGAMFIVVNSKAYR